MPRLQLCPSILAADVGALREGCLRVEQSGADQIHVDVMDGVFVPNVSYGPAVTKMARDAVSIPLNVHLMMQYPDRYVDAFIDAGANTLLVHIEAEHHVPSTLAAIRERGVRPGIVLNPDTELAQIEPVLDLVDEVLFMTVFPGFGGQAFLPQPLERIAALRAMKPDLDIAVDGGLNRETSARCIDAGANLLDIGSAMFNVEDMAAEVQWYREQLS